jgi:hypothetical protein
MAISMQGAWTVRVAVKNAAFAQRFIVSGAATGNGTYAGDVATPAVFVTGSHWTITVQHNPGTGFVASQERIKFPTVSGGQVRFDIESNDSGADADFDDLVLTCSAPQTATEFVVFGHVSHYGDGCIFNPCFRRYLVIDSPIALAEALKISALRQVVAKLYPERTRPVPPRPDPETTFRPLVLPLRDEAALPPKQALAITLGEADRPAPEAPRGKAAEGESAPVPTVTRVRAVALGAAAPTTAVGVDRVALASLFDRFVRRCETGPLPGVVLRFQEYDRTGAELAGGVYTGTGDRETLGVCATDVNGNYVFRFSRSVADLFAEADVDVAAGENEVVQSAPDVIVQLLDAMAPGGVAFETASYANVPLLKRIDICIPRSRLGQLPTACQGQHAIQAIGNVFIGAPTIAPPMGQPPGFGPRVGFSNVLGQTGRITARNVLGPQARCAAWGGRLDLYACFLDHPAATRYTVRHRRLGETDWHFVTEEYRHPRIASIGLPGYSGDVIGPTPAPLHVDGGPAVPAPAYANIESDAAFVLTHRNRKVQLRSATYAPTPGPVQFRIEGYDAAGLKVPGTDDSVTLFIDNSTPTLHIDENVTMGLQTLGDCALLTLPAGQPAAPLTVRFKADQEEGFLDGYSLGVSKGASGAFAVAPPPPSTAPFRERAYVHGDDLACSSLRGTVDDPTADPVTGYVTVDLTPSGGAWLAPSQPFCAFSVTLSASTRVTDGYGVFGTYSAVPVLIGIQA